MAQSQLQTELKLRLKQGRHPWFEGLTCTWCDRPLEPPGAGGRGLQPIRPLTATKDHPQPRSKGGGGMTVWSCYQCNHRKADMSYTAWKLYMEMNPNWFVEEKEEGNIIPLRRKEMFTPQVVAGGLPPSSGNWLMDLPLTTRFTVRKKNDSQNFMCLDLEVVNKTPRTVILYECSTGMPFGQNGRVDPLRFVNQFDLVEKLPSLEEQFDDLVKQEDMEINHGNTDRSDSPNS